MRISVKKLILTLACIIVSNFIIVNYFYINEGSYSLDFAFQSDKDEEVQIFYNKKEDKEDWKEQNSIKVNYNHNEKLKNINIEIPLDSLYLRFDFGNNEGIKNISDIRLSYKTYNTILDKNIFIDKNNQQNIKSLEYFNGNFQLIAENSDPFIVFKLSDTIYSSIYNQYRILNLTVQIILCCIIDIIIMLCIKHIYPLYELFHNLFKDKTLMWRLSKNDFKTKYAGSYLGIIWAFIQPIVTILVYWFVFEYGLKNGSPIEGVPYILWFIAGLVPWFFIQEAINSGTSSLVDYSYLVKKIVFNIDILPIVKIISSFYVHLVFIGFAIIMFILKGNLLNVYSLQLFYYIFCTIFLLIGVSYITCSIYAFFKDLSQIIGIILQILMWMTPILWSNTILTGNLRLLAVLNPIFYITEGYRDSLINKVWFWDKPIQSLYFWCFTIVMLVVGSTVYKKLKQHFADVL
ncbi:ABC transporter permease [Clostridium sp. Marseille-P299]|uniref:ABC transporter permease n=1 Tax=Clostridium sp. Marseille-P299 TaxID=1805477 RepID=UPI000ACE1FF3|nr:ABC transporter permease [Clostridium sp. Marseille-P299]